MREERESVCVRVRERRKECSEMMYLWERGWGGVKEKKGEIWCLTV